MSMQSSSDRGAWSGKLGFVLAAAGSAIGLGNIWRFPYVAGENGGSAFVLIYLACAFVISMPLLTAMFNVVAIYGGMVVAVEWLGSDVGNFWSGMQDSVELWNDVGKGMVKSVIFAVVVTWIAVFQGYDTEPTPEGIGFATTRTVVISSVMILGLDFILTLSMYGEFK